MINSSFQNILLQTYIGDILISVNPYKPLSLYSHEVLHYNIE